MDQSPSGRAAAFLHHAGLVSDLPSGRAYRSCRKFERARDLLERCLLRFAHRNTSDAKKSPLLGCFGNVLADLTQPNLESTSIARRLGVEHRPGFAQRLDALGLDLGRLATGKLFLQAVA